MTDINDLTLAWYEAKEAETRAKNEREEIERKMIKVIGIPDNWDGSLTHRVGDFKVKIARRINVKIDAEALKVIAHDNGLDAQLETMFRGKPEIVKAEWDIADAKVRSIFAPAITSTPSKVSFSVDLISSRRGF